MSGTTITNHAGYTITEYKAETNGPQAGMWDVYDRDTQRGSFVHYARGDWRCDGFNWNCGEGTCCHVAAVKNSEVMTSH